MNTRKFYVAQGGEFEKASEYENALESYLEAFNITECTDDDNAEYFSPGFIEDKIGFLAYRLGDFRTALTFGAKAYRLNPSDDRLRNNLPFYTDAILYVNPKERLDSYIDEFLINNYPEDYTVLDVGPYDGRWSNSLRHHFKHMDAVEAFEPYVEQYNLKEKYDNVFISDVREFNFDHYDIIILGDVVEHMPIEDAQKLLSELKEKSKQLLVVIPFEYPQDEYDNNKYQIHFQEDLTDEIFSERYQGFSLLAKDEVRGAYVLNGTCDSPMIFEPLDDVPKTIKVGLVYYDNGSYSKAIGAFENSAEKLTPEFEALKYFYVGESHKELKNTFEAMQGYSKAVEVLPSYKDAYFELFKILEKFELWEDLERYLKLALAHKDEDSEVDDLEAHPYWDNLLYIQLTLVLTRLHKNFEAYGFAVLATESKATSERNKIAQHNLEELRKELWSTLQINA